MSSFEETITKACREHDIPGAVLTAGSKSGNLHYAQAFGVRSMANPSPLKLDSTMWMASCTKLMTTVAAMQCVERGLLSLDADVSAILPELKDLPILTGFDEQDNGKPILVKNTKPITLRRLLTHSSGLCYDFFHPTLIRYQAYMGVTVPPLGSEGERRIKDKYAYPLLFAPGEGWEYGAGIDWAGQMVERVNDNITLEAYFTKNIWEPLGMQNLTFKPQDHPAVKEKLVDISWRQGGVDEFGQTANPTGKMEATTQRFWDSTTPDCHGGAGLFGPIPEYQKLLQCLLDGGKTILKESTVAEMFKPQLTPASKKVLAKFRSIPQLNNGACAIDMDVETDWGLGGIMNLGEMKTGRKKYSMSWGGYPNLLWWVDREGGVTGMFGGQFCPAADPWTVKLHMMWETEMYAHVNKASGKL